MSHARHEAAEDEQPLTNASKPAFRPIGGAGINKAGTRESSARPPVRPSAKLMLMPMIAPAMAAGVATRLHDVMDLVNLLIESEKKAA